MEQKVSPLQKA